MAWDVYGFDDSDRAPARRRQYQHNGRPARALVKTAPAAAAGGLKGLEDQLGFSFKKFLKGAIRYTNPIGLSVEATKLGTKLARKTSLGRGIFDAVDWLPGGHELNTIIGGRGSGGGGRPGATVGKVSVHKIKKAKKIRLRTAGGGGGGGGGDGAPAPSTRPPDDDEDQLPEGADEGDGDEGEEGGTDEGEGGEDEGGAEMQGLDDQIGFSFKSLLTGAGKGLAAAGKVAGKAGLAIGKTALETYIGRPLGPGQTTAQQAAALQKARAAATPFYKNPIVLAAGAAAVVGGVVLLRKKK